MDISAFSKNHQVKALTRFNECYALVMVIIFSLTPVMATISPRDFGSIFNGVSQLMIWSLVFLGLFQILSYATFNSKNYSVKDRLKFCIQRSGNYFLDHKVGLILSAFLILAIISAVVAYIDGTQVVANLEYSQGLPKTVAETTFENMSFTDTRLFKGTEPDPVRGIGRPDGVFMYLAFATVFVYVSLIKNKAFKKAIFGVNIAGFFIISLIVLQQYYGILGSAGVEEPGEIGRKLMAFYDKKGVRIGHFFKGLTGSFYNSNHVAYYLLVGSMLISGMVVMSKKWCFKIAWSIAALYSYYILIINDTFGCYLALVGALAIVAVIKLIIDFKVLEKGTYKVWRICMDSLLPLILVIFMSVSFIVLSGEDNSITKNFKTFGKDIKTVATSDDKKEEDKVGSGRGKMWTTTIKMIAEEPIFGYGPDNLKAKYVEKGASLDRAHNEPLEKAVSLGIPATIVYYAGVALAIILFVKKRQNFMDSTTLLPFMALVGYLISSLFGVFLFYTAGYFVIMLAFVSSKEPKIVTANTKSPKKHK